MESNHDRGKAYLRARAAADGRVTAVLRDIGRHDSSGDTALRDSAIATLDDLVFRRFDGAPAYRRRDAIAIGWEVAAVPPKRPVAAVPPKRPAGGAVARGVHGNRTPRR